MNSNAADGKRETDYGERERGRERERDRDRDRDREREREREKSREIERERKAQRLTTGPPTSKLQASPWPLVRPPMEGGQLLAGRALTDK